MKIWWLIISSRLNVEYGSKDKLKGEGKKFKPVRYGSLTVLEKIMTNAYHLDLLAYAQMYSIVNV